MIIIPDVHRRPFWKDSVKTKNKDESVIFLGDYLDPYPQEEISNEDALENFKEIIEFKDENSDREIILLLGNHDLPYFSTVKYRGWCRHDYENHDTIRNIFEFNRNKFKLTHDLLIKNIHYLFSHAGLLSHWIGYRRELFGKDSNLISAAKIANELFKKDDSMLLYCLSNDVSEYRGGEFWVPGSLIWADVREHIEEPQEDDSVFQIFGHTQLKSDPYKIKNGICLDCRRSFNLDEETGNIK